MEERAQNRLDVVEARRQRFLADNEFDEEPSPSSIVTPEAKDLQFWCSSQSWSYCDRCNKLAPTKLLPGFRKRAPMKFKTNCKCATQPYCVPDVDDVPLILRGLSDSDVRLLRQFEIHCGDYARQFNGYRQHTGPFRVTWCHDTVEEKLSDVEDDSKRDRLRTVYRFLMAKRDCAYAKLVRMQQRGMGKPFLYQIFTVPEYKGIECALWPTLYHKTSMCESVLHCQENRASAKISYMNKLFSPVMDYALDFELLAVQDHHGCDQLV